MMLSLLFVVGVTLLPGGWFCRRVCDVLPYSVHRFPVFLLVVLCVAKFSPLLFAVYFLSIGGALWVGSHSAGWVLTGQILCGLSIVPIGIYIYQWIKECRFLSRQQKLDREDKNNLLLRAVEEANSDVGEQMSLLPRNHKK
jgi:uncharacterized membrane protein